MTKQEPCFIASANVDFVGQLAFGYVLEVRNGTTNWIDDGGNQHAATNQGEQHSKYQAANGDIANRGIAGFCVLITALRIAGQFLNQSLTSQTHFVVKRIDFGQQERVGFKEFAFLEQSACQIDAFLGETLAGIAKAGQQFLLLVGK